MKHDINYLNGLNCVLKNGVEKIDRTGVGTISVTGLMIKYDLRDGTIPVLTTKKINIDPLRKELEWFISGTGSEKRLEEMGVGIWKNWATNDGHLNYVYGYQWRRWPAILSPGYQYVKDLSDYIPREFNIPDNAIELHQEKNFYVLNDEIISDEWYLWRQLIANNNNICPEWHLFENFQHDVRYLPGYFHWKNDKINYQLTPFWSNAIWSSRDTCAFVHINDMRNFNELPHKNGYVIRRKLYHDQLEQVINEIKTNPFSRRIKVNAWNVDLLDQMQLPPCHYDFTFINVPTDNGIETSLQLNMRSNDYCIGNPFNIAQYAILLRMICHLCNTKPGDLIYVGTDVHVYSNHINEAKIQLTRDPYESPTLTFNDKTYNSIDDFKWNDIIINDYNYHPFIKFPIAV